MHVDNIIVEIVETNDGQMVRLPEGFRIDGQTVSIRGDGDAVILEPIRAAAWPEGFYDKIRIDDPTFVRPDQGNFVTGLGTPTPGSEYRPPATVLTDENQR